jgi:predicted transport protein
MPHHTLPQNQEFHKQILNMGNPCNNVLEKEITQSLNQSSTLGVIFKRFESLIDV